MANVCKSRTKRLGVGGAVLQLIRVFAHHKKTHVVVRVAAIPVFKRVYVHADVGGTGEMFWEISVVRAVSCRCIAFYLFALRGIKGK